MSVTEKFHKYLPLLEETVEGTVFLDLKNPKLYKKLIRYYANEGVEFQDDGNEYATVVQCLAEDLEQTNDWNQSSPSIWALSICRERGHRIEW